jgi:hypothetical protein
LRCPPAALKRFRLPPLPQPRQRSTRVTSRQLFTGVVINTIAAGIIIVGIAITVGTTATMDGIGIITIIAAIGVDPAYARFARYRP